MNRGRVYLWTPDLSRPVGGFVQTAVVPLLRLDEGDGREVRLSGRFAEVHNGGAINEPDPQGDGVRARSLGGAVPDADGNFLFQPGRGGGRIDKVVLAERSVRERYVQAARFGEVNTYFHLDHFAAYVDGLLQELGHPSLPRVIAVVSAHPAAVEVNGMRDGERRQDGRWLPFQGGHYRLPNSRYTVSEHQSLSPNGEIHLGPGWRLLPHGALAEAAGRPYRANASHNAGIIYHEYGHHLSRHTADFAVNAQRRPDRQRNTKSAIEEGTCDYWVATLLDTPHIRAWNRPNQPQAPHWRCLTSAKTMADYDSRPTADPHANGTIWGAALWRLRGELRKLDSQGGRSADLLLLKALLLLGQLRPAREDAGTGETQRVRTGFNAGLAALLHGDIVLHAGAHRTPILSAFAAHGILPDPFVLRMLGSRPFTVGSGQRSPARTRRTGIGHDQ